MVGRLMALPLLLGECPSPAGDRFHDFPLSGAVGKRLCEFAGISLPPGERDRFGSWYWELREHFDCLNAMERYTSPWSAPAARERWTSWLLTRSEAERREPLVVVCLGRRAAAAVGHDRPWFEWFEVGLLRAVTIPHPSARNLLNNDPRMRERAGEVLREAMTTSSWTE